MMTESDGTSVEAGVVDRETALSRPALDAIPINVAVLDADGEILLTNRAWDEFAVAEGDVEEPTDLGSNYLATTDVTDDEYARLAGEGIESVLASDRDLFTLEYPCHSPTERRWFLMRVTRFTIEGAVFAVVAHIDITDRKLAEIAADEHASQLEHVLDRLNGIVGDVTTAAVHARSRGELESATCEQFVATEPYDFAWIARPDLRADTLVPSAWAGSLPADFDERSLSLSAGDEPTVRAYVRGEPQFVAEAAAPDVEWDPTAADAPVAIAAVPLTYRSKTYGVLTVGAAAPDPFDARERAVLEALGRTVATTIHGLTTGQVLRAASLVELSLTIEGADPLGALVASEDARLTYHDSMVADDGNLLVYASVAGIGPDGLAGLAEEHPQVVDVAVLTVREDEVLVTATLADSIVGAVADHDGLTTDLSVADDTIEATVLFPDDETARAGFEHLVDRYDGVELRGYRERERESDTAGGFRATVEAALTDRQLTALRTAYFSGYFEWPRPVSGEEVADSMGITRATFHQHLREAHRKLAAAFFEAGGP